MTCIVQYKTKIEFRKAVQARVTSVLIEDPSIFAPFSGRLVDYMKTYKTCVVTNHPKRSWYAEVHEGRDGYLKVT